jgi:hypothetical protein
MADQRDQCILFSVVFTRSPSSHHDSVWVLPIIFHCTAGAGLPNHIMVEVLWDPKRRRSWDASILLVADCSFKFCSLFSARGRDLAWMWRGVVAITGMVIVRTKERWCWAAGAIRPELEYSPPSVTSGPQELNPNGFMTVRRTEPEFLNF